MQKIDRESLGAFRAYLSERECAGATIKKYMHDVGLLAAFCGGAISDKGVLIAFKEHLIEDGYAESSVNSMLAAVNRLVVFLGCPEWKLRYLRTAKGTFYSVEKKLTQVDYERLVRTAKRLRDDRLELLVQTICATGIRVSEVRAVTVESLRQGRTRIRNKGRTRVVLMPKKLCGALALYCKKRGIRRGSVFVTRTGRPLDRSNIWKMMKRLGQKAGVQGTKVFPHNLRHLFARTYYEAYKDIVRLADILGHASIDTTRIYTARTGEEQQRQIEHLPLLL